MFLKNYIYLVEQTNFWNFIKNFIFTESMLGQISTEINIIKVKTMNVGSFIQKNRATKITNDWYLWIHHTIDNAPSSKIENLHGKKHLENQTGTKIVFKPVKISKKILKKNMRLGNFFSNLVNIFILFKYCFG